MSKYTTGELAKLCGVSVRTVQYYDSRNILTPSALSEGGRRLYSDADLQKLKVICFLRSLDLPISAIGDLLSEEHPEQVIQLLLDQQEALLTEELNEQQKKLQMLQNLRQELKQVKQFSVESIGDIAYNMKHKQALRRIRITIGISAVVFSLLEYGSLFVGIFTKVWWPFLVCIPVLIVYGIWISHYYFTRIHYICPTCHTVFKPAFKEAFFARHTPATRKLTCTSCGHHGFCVETPAEDGV